MAQPLILSDQEIKLRQLLLDTADYIGNLNGFRKPELRFAGGWVRDKLLGLSSYDVDIGIDNMTGDRFTDLMKQFLESETGRSKYKPDILGRLAPIKKNPDRSKHLETVTTKIFGLDTDFVNLRRETYREASRTPTMAFGTPEEDALRRDATINALFYNLNFDSIEDFTQRGRRDMQLKVIKTPLPPVQTFEDDPLRVLRAIRFASRFGFEIAAEDKAAMSLSKIKDALRAKISRERVGIEILKMLNGPDPHMALRLIDSVGLYDTVFTYPTNGEYERLQATNWSRVYDGLRDLIESGPELIDSTSNLPTIKRLLIRRADDLFLAWLAACFIPWDRAPNKLPQKFKAKKLPSPASLAAREGIKADNRLCKIVDDAVNHRGEIIRFMEGFKRLESCSTPPLKRRSSSVDRASLGMAIRRWGSHWRSSVIFSLLNDLSGASTLEDRICLYDGYATWLRAIEISDLLDVDQLKPLVTGNDISKSFVCVKLGPWMQKAMDIAMEWQLNNPEAVDATGGIQEVIDRRHELGINER